MKYNKELLKSIVRVIVAFIMGYFCLDYFAIFLTHIKHLPTLLDLTGKSDEYYLLVQFGILWYSLKAFTFFYSIIEKLLFGGDRK